MPVSFKEIFHAVGVVIVRMGKNAEVYIFQRDIHGFRVFHKKSRCTGIK